MEKTSLRIKMTLVFVFLLLLSTTVLRAKPMFEVTAEGIDYTEVVFNLSGYELSTYEIDGISYMRLNHQEGGLLMEEGLPETLTFSFILSLPNTGIVTTEEPIIIDRETIKGVNIFPSQGFDLDIDEKRGFLKDEIFYEKDILYPSRIVEVTSPAIMRDLRLVSVTLYPFTFNPARQELTVVNSLSLRINYDTTVRGENEITRPPRRLSRSFQKMYRGSVLNYGQFRNPDQEYQARSILIVRHHSESINTTVDQFINWKRDKGFEIATITTANYSNTNTIKNYIQNAYNNWEDPPEYVIIIGGAGDGSLQVPYWQANGRSDHQYTLLDGNDDLMDVFIGRISVSDAQGLGTFWNKLRNYEREPYLGETAWYQNNLLVGHVASSSGESTRITNKYIKEIMKRHNPNYTFNEVYTGAFPTQMNTGVNLGASFFNFRGYIGMAGWTPNDANFTNVKKVSNGVFITCSTLDFNGGQQCEPFFRSGTPTTSKGGISVIGMTTSATRTAFNNCLDGGIFYGIFVENMRSMGEALARGKLNLWQNYGNSHPTYVPGFTSWANLVGDPSMDVWVELPKTLNVTFPEILPLGSNSIKITVRDADEQPLGGAWVTIRQGNDTIFATGFTDSEGNIIHLFSQNSSGEIKVTATKPDYKPYHGSFNITGGSAVTFQNAVYDGDIIAGNEIDFVLTVKNHTQGQVNGVTGTISTTGNYVNITTNGAAFGNITAQGTAESATDFSITLAPETPVGHKAYFDLNITDNAQNNWQSRFMITVQNGSLIPVEILVMDGNNGVLEPGEIANLKVRLRNTGDKPLTNIYGILRGVREGLTISDTLSYFGNINVGQSVLPVDNDFVVSVTSYVYPGTIYDLELYLYNNFGFSQTRRIKLPIGVVRINDPLGPDEYGYWIFDDGDTTYVDVPTYEWIEIASTEGGPGQNTGLQSDHVNNHQVRVMDLPFTFRFYGIDYNQVSICANGWISFGVTEQTSFRNWRLPGPLGPSAMVAAFWDNLSLAQGGVYTYYDNERDIFIIQWQNALNIINNAPETFQIILYNPANYHTRTDDGAIKIQYKVFNNVNNGAGTPSGNWGNYSTVGIADHTCKVGLEYSYNNRYPAAAKPLGNERAIYITTGLSAVYIAVESHTFTDNNDNLPSYGETGTINLTLINLGIEDSNNITAEISTEDNYVTVLANIAEFGDIPSEDTATVNGVYFIQIADDVPSNHRAKFKVTITEDEGMEWTDYFYVIMAAPSLTTLTQLIYDPAPDANNNGLIDPGEQLIMYLPVTNVGRAKSPAVNVTITSESNLATITDISDNTFNFIRAGESQYTAVSLSISNNAVTGDRLPFRYRFDSGNYTFEGIFLLGVGGVIPVQLGQGDTITNVNGASPINIYFRSLRSQTVYTREEIEAAGITSGLPIVQMGYYVADAPAHPLLNFKIRMKHTTEFNCANHDPGPFTQVYSDANYAPVPGGWDMLTFNPPFEWNGVDNILVDTSFAPVIGWSSSGRVRIYNVDNGFRFTRADNPDQSNVETITAGNDKPQVLLLMGTDPNTTGNKPQSLTAEVVGVEIHLAWQPPTGGGRNGNNAGERFSRIAQYNQRDFYSQYRNPDGYNVFRNGLKINEEPIELTEYIDNRFNPSGTNYYYVTALYENYETLPSNVVGVSVNMVAMPIINPEGGMYYDRFEVAISSEEEDVNIYYTLDGSEPTTDALLYEEPFEIVWHTQIKAKAFRDNWYPSETVSAQYTILYAPRNLAIQTDDDSAAITWDEPVSPQRGKVRNSTIFNDVNDRSRTRLQTEIRNSGNYRILSGYNIFRAVNDGDFIKLNDDLLIDTGYIDTGLETGIYAYYTTAEYDIGESQPSSVVYGYFGITAPPTFSPEPGNYQSAIDVAISSATDGAIIYYTLDGNNPNQNSTIFSGQPLHINDNTTIKAYAIRNGWVESSIAVGEYTFTLSADSEEMPLLKTELFNAYPNPFNPQTTIHFYLRDECMVELSIYNILGQKVKSLIYNYLTSGEYNIIWNGDDNSGKRVGSGLYFYKLTTPKYSAVKKVIVLK